METKKRKLSAGGSESLSKWKHKNGSKSNSSVITVEVDTRSPIVVLQKIIGRKLRIRELSNHDIYLQDIELYPMLSLFDQGVKVDGKVELSVQVETQDGSGKLTITEITKIMTDDEMKDYMQRKTDRANTPRESVNEEKEPSDGDRDSNPLPSSNIGISSDPCTWSEEQVYNWMLWLAKELQLDTSVIKDLKIDGKQLTSMSIDNFLTKIPFANIMLSHLTFLKKFANQESVESKKEIKNEGSAPLNLVINVTQEPATSSSLFCLVPPSTVPRCAQSLKRTTAATSTTEKNWSMNRHGSNGQIQLWQFLLELLMDSGSRDIIRWVGDEGEFMLVQPERVAKKWGERKNKPAMNYEKLSRALRYYYDGQMINKVHGKRFVYKYVCNLKEILGCDAAELDRLVNEEIENKRKQGQVSSNSFNDKNDSL